MEKTPTTDDVYQTVYTLYNNSNSKDKEKASKWLEVFQKSIYSWTVADELLQLKRDRNSCYFAAQTMRSKIQNSFHELPASAHESLRDSLIVHIGQITSVSDPVIVTQLCLAVADLVLLMATWKNAIISLMENLSGREESLWPLLEILYLIPEETTSRYLRLGANRRDEIRKELEVSSRTVSEFLVACLTNCVDNLQLQEKVIKCFTAWASIHAIPLEDFNKNIIVQQVFNLLGSPNTSGKLHDIATDCLCTLLQCLENNSRHYPNQELLEMQIFNGILTLETCYHTSVAHEDMDKTINYCRIFTALGETFVFKIVSNDQTPHYSIKSLDLIITCVGHYDYEIAEITFNMWYRLSEELFHKNNDRLTNHFKPYIERLIGALYRHSQIDPDHDGLIDESDSFSDFRRKVSDLITDVVFIVGSINCFKQMFLILQEPTCTWESTEAALFVMQNVAQNILPDENEIVPKVVEAILCLPENTHIAFRYTSILLLGSLSEWVEQHPETLQAVLNFLLYALQQKNGLASAAALALTGICSACRFHMTCHLNGLIEIARNIDTFEISNDAAIALLKGISVIVARLPTQQIGPAMHEICSFQFAPLVQLVESNNNSITKGERNDPTYWIDRASAIIRHVERCFDPDEVNPTVKILTEAWPVLSSVMNKYQSDLRIMERTCRLLRYGIRAVGKQVTHLLEPIVKQIVCLYAVHQHCCFLYLGSILVDEFASLDECTSGLLEMLQAFIEPTFKMLQVENGLKNNPDTVEDFFRLSSRFIECCPFAFLQSPLVTPIIQCALLACVLDHNDAHTSVMKFFCNLLKCGIPNGQNAVTCQFAKQIVSQNAEALVNNLIHASVYYLHSYMLTDVAEVLFELKNVEREHLEVYLKRAVVTLPKENSGGCVTATKEQLDEFINAILRSDKIKNITVALKDFTRLYR